MLEKLSPPYKFSKNNETKMQDYTKSPTLKTKILVNIKDMSIYSRFFDNQDEKVNVLDYLNKRFFAVPALAIESIYIGDAYTTFQIKKLPEAVIYPSDELGNRRLLKPMNSLKNTKESLKLTDMLKQKQNIDENTKGNNDEEDTEEEDKTKTFRQQEEKKRNISYFN